MIRLHITAEGQTEKAFVDQILTGRLAAFGVYADARCVLSGRDKKAAKAYRRVETLEARMQEDIEDSRFVPYLLWYLAAIFWAISRNSSRRSAGSTTSTPLPKPSSHQRSCCVSLTVARISSR